MNLLKKLKEKSLELYPFDILTPLDNEGFQDLTNVDNVIIQILSGKSNPHILVDEKALQEYLESKKRTAKIKIEYLKRLPPSELEEWHISELEKFLVREEIETTVISALENDNVELCVTLYNKVLKEDPKYKIIEDILIKEKDVLRATDYYFQNEELFKIILCNYPDYIAKFDFSGLEALIEKLGEEIKEEYPISAALLFATCEKFDKCVPFLKEYTYPIFSVFSTKSTEFKKKFLQAIPQDEAHLRIKLREQLKYFEEISPSEFPYLLPNLSEDQIINYIKNDGKITVDQISQIIDKIDVKKLKRIKSKSAKKIVLLANLSKKCSIPKLKKIKKMLSLEEKLTIWDGTYKSAHVLELDYPYLYYTATSPHTKYRIAEKIIESHKDKSLEELIEYMINLPKVNPEEMASKVGYLVSAYANKYGKAVVSFSSEGLGYKLKRNRTIVIKGDVKHKIIAPKGKIRIESGDIYAPIFAREIEIISEKTVHVKEKVWYRKRLYSSPIGVTFYVQPEKRRIVLAKLKIPKASETVGRTMGRR